MSIQDLRAKFKGFVTDPEYLLALLIIAVSLTSFWLGRLSVEGDRTEVFGTSLSELHTMALDQDASAASLSPTDSSYITDTTAPPEGGYVASKNGSKYHLPWCAGAKQISEKNKIFFATKEEAESAGYTPASNCKGI